MRRRRRSKRPQPKIYVPQARKNEQIRAKEVRLIDDTETNLGVLSLEDALAKAKEAGLDLVEISADAKPPVVKIISYDKYRYQAEKKAKKQARQQKSSSSKRIQISFRSAENDLEIKAKKGNAFMEQGHQLEIMMTLRGREKGKKDFAKQKMLDFVKKYINPNHQVISHIRPGGRGMTMLITPKTP